MRSFKVAYQFKILNALIDKLKKIVFPDKGCRVFSKEKKSPCLLTPEDAFIIS